MALFNRLAGPLAILLAFLPLSATAGAPLPGPLVTADWLSENLDAVVVLDVRKELDAFTAVGHIEGAVLVNAKKIRVDKTLKDVELTRMLPDRKAFEAFMSAHGVSSDDTVVLTHGGKKPGHVTGATRLYWQLKYYGFQNVAMLDGGNAAWVEALEELVPDETEVTPGNFVAGEAHPEILATLEDIEKALNGNGDVLVDTRALRFHIGLEQRDYVYAPGHLPNSLILPYQFLHPEKKTALYFPVEKQQAILDSLQIDADKPLILYCNSGYEATSIWFMLHEVMGKKNVRVYDGSLHEWTKDSSRPMTTELGYFK
jgi:thiosulfate/3-mercaptopyruvate sulfurtransferase